MNKELKDAKEDVVIDGLVDESVININPNEERKVAMRIDRSNKRLEMIDKRIQAYQAKRDRLVGEIDRLDVSLKQKGISKITKS